MQKDINKIFNLQGVIIDKVEFNDEQKVILIKARSPKNYANCQHCGQSATKVHQYHFRKIKHGQLNYSQVIIHLRVRRIKCKKCGKIFTEKIKGIDRKKTSLNFRLQAMDWLQRNSFNYIGQKFNISPSTLIRYLVAMFDNWTIDWDKITITKLGIDEHSFKGRNLIITIADLSNHKLLAILKADTQIELENFLKNIPVSAQKRLKEVCIDLCSSYREAVKKCLPGIKITADRFHVEGLGKRALDEIRQIIQVEEGKRKIHLKQLLLTNHENLSLKELDKLDKVFERYKAFPALKEAWIIKEKIRQIYWAKNKQEALKRFQQAIMLLETAHDSYFLKTLLKTLKEWKNEILNYFDNKTTNGFTEGCHTKIKMLKRVSFGFRNINNYIAKMTLAFLPLLWIINYHTL